MMWAAPWRLDMPLVATPMVAWMVAAGIPRSVAEPTAKANLAAMDAARVDVLLCPPFATAAFPHGGARNFTLAASYTMLFNLTQLPAGVVPVTRVRADEAVRDPAPGETNKVDTTA